MSPTSYFRIKELNNYKLNALQQHACLNIIESKYPIAKL